MSLARKPYVKPKLGGPDIVAPVSRARRLTFSNGRKVWKNFRHQESLDLERALRKGGISVPDEFLSNDYEWRRYC